MKTTTTRNRAAEIALVCLLVANSPLSLAAADLGYGMLYGMAVSHDGRFAATGGTDGAFLWDLDTGQMIRRIPLPQDPPSDSRGVVALAFSPDDQTIAGLCERDSYGQPLSGEVRLWAVGDGSLLQLLKIEPRWLVQSDYNLNRAEAGVDFSPDGSRLMAYHHVDGEGGLIEVWDLAGSSPVRSEPDRVYTSTNHVGPALFSDSGAEILVWSKGDRSLEEPDTLRILDTDSGDVLRQIGPFPEGTYASLGRSRIATWYKVPQPVEAPPCIVEVFDTASGDQVESLAFSCTWLGGFYRPAMVLSEDGRTLATAGGEIIDDGEGEPWEVFTTLVMDVDTGTEVRRWTWPVPDTFLTKDPVVFVPNTTRLILQDAPCIVYQPLEVWDWQTGETGVRLAGHGPESGVVAVAGDGTRALMTHQDCNACGARPRGYTSLWDLEREQVIQSYPISVFPSAVAEDFSVFLALDNRGSGVYGSSVSLWDISSGEQVSTFANPIFKDWSWALSASGDLVLGAGVDAGGGLTATVFDAADGSQLASKSFEEGVIYNLRAVRFLSDGKVVLAADDTTLLFWDFETDRVTRFELPLGLRSLPWSTFAVSPDGSRVLTDFGLWDTAMTEALARFDPPLALSAAAFYPDGKWAVASARESGGDEPWGPWILDATTGRVLRTGVGEIFLDAVAFSPDGFINGVGSPVEDWWRHARVSRWDVRDLLASPELVAGPSGLEVRWGLGTLQFAPTTAGPWTDLPAASPFPLAPIGDKGFFRVRVE